MADHPLLVPNPVVTKRLNVPPERKGKGKLVTFTGWVGETKRPKVTRLHLNINDLTQILEFNTEDVVHVAAVTEETMPGNAVCVWLPGSTKVKVIRIISSTAAKVSQAFVQNQQGAG